MIADSAGALGEPPDRLQASAILVQPTPVAQPGFDPPGRLTLLPRSLFALHARAAGDIEALRRQGVVLLSLVASAPDNAAAIAGLAGA